MQILTLGLLLHILTSKWVLGQNHLFGLDTIEKEIKNSQKQAKTPKTHLKGGLATLRCYS